MPWVVLLNSTDVPPGIHETPPAHVYWMLDSESSINTILEAINVVVQEGEQESEEIDRVMILPNMHQNSISEQHPSDISLGGSGVRAQTVLQPRAWRLYPSMVRQDADHTRNQQRRISAAVSS